MVYYTKIFLSVLLALAFSSFSSADILTDCNDVVSLYHFDGDADDDIGGNNGIIQGASFNSSGKFGGTFSFDGSNDYIDLGNFDASGGEMSISVWIKSSDFANCGSDFDCRIISKAVGLQENDHYFMLSTYTQGGAVLRFRLKAGGETDTLISTGERLNENAWYHVVAVYDGTEMILYQDGIEVGRKEHKTSGDITISASTPVWVGASPSGQKFWKGEVDEVTVYDKALSSDEVLLLSSAASPISCAPSVCGDGSCAEDETCSSCSQDCLDVGEVCCSGEAFSGDCCSANDCIATEACTSNVCVTPDLEAPSQVTGLSLNAVSLSQVDLAWAVSSDNRAVTGYKIYRDNILIDTSNINSYSDTGLLPETAYVYKVSAYDAAGNEGMNSTESSVITPNQSSQIYYVSTIGDNSWDGKCYDYDGATCGPWRTLSYATANMGGGNTLIIKEGMYTGRENIMKRTIPSGTAFGYTTIRAENMDFNVLVDSRGFGSDGDYPYPVLIDGESYIQIEGLRFMGPGDSVLTDERRNFC